MRNTSVSPGAVCQFKSSMTSSTNVESGYNRAAAYLAIVQGGTTVYERVEDVSTRILATLADPQAQIATMDVSHLKRDENEQRMYAVLSKMFRSALGNDCGGAPIHIYILISHQFVKGTSRVAQVCGTTEHAKVNFNGEYHK